jgi:F0F1-type ATP synthase alpha subunit
LLLVNNNGLLDQLSVSQIRQFEKEFLEVVSLKYASELEAVGKSGVLPDDFGAKLLGEAETIIKQMKN